MGWVVPGDCGRTEAKTLKNSGSLWACAHSVWDGGRRKKDNEIVSLERPVKAFSMCQKKLWMEGNTQDCWRFFNEETETKHSEGAKKRVWEETPKKKT